MLLTGVELPTVSTHLIDIEPLLCSQAQIGPFVGLRSLDGIQRSNLHLDVARVGDGAWVFESKGCKHERCHRTRLSIRLLLGTRPVHGGCPFAARPEGPPPPASGRSP